MKTIQIEFGLEGPPKVFPDTETCLSGETLVFSIASKNPLIEAVNVAFDDQGAECLCCPGSAPGSRQYHCKINLESGGDPAYPKSGVMWGIAVEHNAEVPRTLKYTITPFVLGNPYPAGELDPYIIVTKRPASEGARP
jgi:hypothetical protein